MSKKLGFVFILALVLRLLLIPIAFHGDLYNNLSWGNSFVKYGPVNYYERTVWDHSAPNQPPLYIILFGFTSFLFFQINNLINYLNSHVGVFPSGLIWFWQANGNTILLKLPGIIADLSIGFLIYKFFPKKQALGLKLSILWLFNPISWYNSAIWGQTDAIVNLLGLLSVYFLLKKKLIPSMFFISLSILFKGSLVIFIPIILVVWIYQKHSIGKWLLSFIYSLIPVILISFLFHHQFDLPIWLFNLYTNKIFPGEIGYLTANAFNFWYLVNPGRVLDNTSYFGLQAHLWGYLISLIAGAIIVIRLLKNKTQETVLFSLSMMALISFLFFTRIHERYLYPFFPIMTILIGLNKKYIFPYLILSLVFLLNMYNLFWAPEIVTIHNVLSSSQLPIILSIINLVTFLGIILV